MKLKQPSSPRFFYCLHTSCNNVALPYFTFWYLPSPRNIKILKIGDDYIIAVTGISIHVHVSLIILVSELINFFFLIRMKHLLCIGTDMPSHVQVCYLGSAIICVHGSHTWHSSVSHKSPSIINKARQIDSPR